MYYSILNFVDFELNKTFQKKNANNLYELQYKYKINTYNDKIVMEYFHIWFLVIGFSYIVILFSFMHFSDKIDILNNTVGFMALSFVLIHILLFFLLMYQEISLHPLIILVWILALTIPIFFVSILIGISTLLAYGYKKGGKDFSKIGKKLEERNEGWSKAKKDLLRKLNHVLIFLGLLFVWYVGLLIVNYITGSTSGMIPEENNTLLQYFKLISIPFSIIEVLFSLGWFYYLLFFFFYLFSIIILATEFTRKSKYLFFPFTVFTKIYLTNEETQSYGTYLYFAIGHLFAAFICPPMVFLTILGISSISDLVTSQIGIRYGKRYITWNEKKTWEGTISGVLATLLISFLFVGVFWSIIFALAFLFFDIVTNKPLNISDNLLIPIGCSLIFIVIRFYFNLDYFTILLVWF
ncbi:hypothetical protein LCGC14_0731870 [marine sediment metagenome]|uniref:Phosphatidate cytidylyltransferase n=1 Tax=marine sediment metagenome TaxID=412755 RepID=A0A0F9TGK9_9ZZZZ|nr:MAG: Cytidylyltransferase family protein [Candidatus Lokiarchaeum sp. GC14_75]